MMLRNMILTLSLATQALFARTIDLSSLPYINIIGVVNMDIVKEAQGLLAEGSKFKEIAILVNSPGGSVDAGQLFTQAMEQLKSRGTKITCVSGVLAASMGFQILAHCDRVIALPSTLLLFHPVRISSNEGMTSEMLAYYKQQMDLVEPVLNKDLQKKFKFPKEYFSYHYRAETLHAASELAKVTDAIEIYNDVKGFDEMLYTYKKPSLFDLFGGKTWTKIMYIAPQSVQDLFK